MACARCGNRKHEISPDTPFPYCGKCIICPECDGSQKSMDPSRRSCQVCDGRGWLYKKTLEEDYEPPPEDSLPMPEDVK